MDSKEVGFKQSRYAKYSEIYKFLDDIWDGLVTPDELRPYLPRRGSGPTLESDASYRLRLLTTKLPRAFRDGIEKGIGRFGIAVLTEDVPEAIQDIADNVNGAGKTMDLLVFKVLSHLMRYGCCAVLTDVMANEEAGQPVELVISIIPVSSIQNAAIAIDGSLQRLVVASEEEITEGYDAKMITLYREYTADSLVVYEEKDSKVSIREERALLNADGEPRGEVFAVWFSCDPTSTPWYPVAPPFTGLAKDCVLQMLKESELNRAEAICNTQVIKRYHPQGVDPTQRQPPIPWDPETVVEIPFGGDVKVDEPTGAAISTTHQRNKDRHEQMNQTVDGWLNEKVRTATEAALSDDAVRSRLEIISKSVSDGFSQLFRFCMALADRRFEGDAGTIELSATTYNQVTDEEIKMATEDYGMGTLTLPQIQAIKTIQWRSRGYELPEGTPQPLDDDILEG